jgi:hypothetical protein
MLILSLIPTVWKKLCFWSFLVSVELSDSFRSLAQRLVKGAEPSLISGSTFCPCLKDIFFFRIMNLKGKVYGSVKFVQECLSAINEMNTFSISKGWERVTYKIIWTHELSFRICLSFILWKDSVFIRNSKKDFSIRSRLSVRDRDVWHQSRSRDQRLNPRLYDGLNSVNFCTSEVTLFQKKSRKVLVVD